MKYWLMKSEPDVFSIDHLMQKASQVEPWNGVRNYQVRNFIRDDMRCGDLAFFYHSGCKNPGIVGIVEIVKQAYPDHTAFDPQSQYFDPKSDPLKPRWLMVDVKLRRKFPRCISLAELKADPNLKEMWVVKRGNRLSITPVTKPHFDYILHTKLEIRQGTDQRQVLT